MSPLWFALGVAVAVPLINLLGSATRIIRSCEPELINTLEEIKETAEEIKELAHILKKSEHTLKILDELIENTNYGVEAMELVPIKKKVKKIFGFITCSQPGGTSTPRSPSS
jgi:hypothetical protein